MLQNFGTAYAQGQGASSPAFGGIANIVLLVAIFAIFYFLLIRPQQKREKERKNMIAAIKKGDKVLTTGGMIGIVDTVREDDVVLLKVSGNTKVEFTKSAIQAKIA